MDLQELKKLCNRNVVLGMPVKVVQEDGKMGIKFNKRRFYFPMGHGIDETRVMEDLWETGWDDILRPLNLLQDHHYWVWIKLKQEIDSDDDGSWRVYTVEETEFKPLFFKDHTGEVAIFDVVIEQIHEFEL